jgi:citronellol/citronellal dehydrogenase
LAKTINTYVATVVYSNALLDLNHSNRFSGGNPMSLKGKRIFISGASRGIGLEIAKACARDGAMVAIAAKTAEPHPKLPGTIYTAAKEIEEAGGKALPLVCDIRFEDDVNKAVEAAVAEFGGLDICINNASAINLSGTDDLTMKQYDLMHQINGRGSYLVTKACLPYLKQGNNPHVLNLAPPLAMYPKWFAQFPAYAAAKYTMSLWVLGMAEEFKKYGIAVNALWPRSYVSTSVSMAAKSDAPQNKNARKPNIMGEAAYHILSRTAAEFTGNFCIDDLILAEEGVTDFEQYHCYPGEPLLADLFLPDDLPASPGGEEFLSY